MTERNVHGYYVMRPDVEEIKPPKMPRSDLGDINKLANSIDDLGLLQPIGVDKDKRLLFGERRLAAVKQLGWKKISAIEVEADSPEAVALAENDIRKAFTSEERAKRIAKITAAHAEGKTTRQIAEEEGISQTQVQRDLKESSHVDSEPGDGSKKRGKKSGKTGSRRKHEKPPMRALDNGPPSKSQFDDSEEDEEKPDPTIEEEIKERNSEIEHFCRELPKWIDANLPKDPWLNKDLGRRGTIDAKVSNICETARSAKCHAPCPKCSGEGCRSCHDTGRVPRSNYQQMT